MSIDRYVKEQQPLVYRTFLNAFENHRLAHAYLLCGEAGFPMKEIALYLAKSMLCDHGTPFADLTCNTCKRIDDEQYPDFLLIDGSMDTIKKQEISDLVDLFQKTAFEKKGIMVYVINEVENMTIEAINSLLKFLEEPSPNTYAILTTRNVSKVLPTIVSRCETVRLLLSPREEIVREATLAGVSADDAEILSFFYNNAELVKQESKDKTYQDIKEAFYSFLEFAKKGAKFARYSMEKDVIPVANSKIAARRFFDLMTLALKDIYSLSRGGEAALPSIKERTEPLVSTFPKIDEALMNTMTLRGEIEMNLNVGLILNHLVHLYFKE